MTENVKHYVENSQKVNLLQSRPLLSPNTQVPAEGTGNWKVSHGEKAQSGAPADYPSWFLLDVVSRI